MALPTERQDADVLKWVSAAPACPTVHCTKRGQRIKSMCSNDIGHHTAAVQPPWKLHGAYIDVTYGMIRSMDEQRWKYR